MFPSIAELPSILIIFSMQRAHFSEILFRYRNTETMAASVPSAPSWWILWLFTLFLSSSSVVVSSNERSLSLDKSATLQLSPGLPVQNSPGLKPGASVFCERVHIHGLPRFRNLRKFSHSVKVKVLPTNSSVHLPNIEICFHRNASLGLGMCPQGQWEKVSKGSWARSMSPFDHKMLDIRTAGSTLEKYEVSIEEEFLLHRVVVLILGIILMSLASFLSKLLVLYYLSAMAVGIILVILMILFQGMKLLPTGRKSSLAIFLYSCVVGSVGFFLRYVPCLFRSVLTELGVNEDMYNPLAIFFLAFVALAGAWLGFWVVHKLVLTEDGSVDTNISNFVAWAIWIFGVIMILKSSMDPLLGTLPLFFAQVLFLLKKVLRLRCLRRLRRSLSKSPKKNRRRSQVPDSSPFDDLHDEYMYKMQSKENSKLLRPKLKNFTLSPCKSSEQGFTRTPTEKLSLEESYPSIIHTTPERRKFSKVEWDTFTQESTEKALEQLVSSPDFGRWLVTNKDRISISPTKIADRQHRSMVGRWLFWS